MEGRERARGFLGRCNEASYLLFNLSGSRSLPQLLNFEFFRGTEIYISFLSSFERGGARGNRISSGCGSGGLAAAGSGGVAAAD